jgi:hypothetical protein
MMPRIPLATAMTGRPARGMSPAAVMAGRSPDQVESDSDLQATYRKLDYFPTPPWAARAGAELVRSVDPEARTMWEAACGAGHMAAALSEYFEVFASDIYPHGYGEVIDFLGEDPGHRPDWLVTNPPFRTADQFVRLGLERARRGVALLLRLSFLEGAERHGLLYGVAPLSICAPCTERVPMALAGQIRQRGEHLDVDGAENATCVVDPIGKNVSIHGRHDEANGLMELPRKDGLPAQRCKWLAVGADAVDLGGFIPIDTAHCVIPPVVSGAQMVAGTLTRKVRP